MQKMFVIILPGDTAATGNLCRVPLMLKYECSRLIWSFLYKKMFFFILPGDTAATRNAVTRRKPLPCHGDDEV